MGRRAGRKRNQGFTLTELAIVFGVIGFILAAVWIAAARVSAANKVDKATAQVMQILTNYRALYAQHGIDVAEGSDVTATGCNLNLFPASMLVGTVACSATSPTTYPVDPWGGTVAVTVSQADSAIFISLTSLPQSACNALANALMTGPDVVFEQIYSGSSNAYHSETFPPYGTGTAWKSADFNGYCENSPLNQIQIGFKAR